MQFTLALSLGSAALQRSASDAPPPGGATVRVTTNGDTRVTTNADTRTTAS